MHKEPFTVIIARSWLQRIVLAAFLLLTFALLWGQESQTLPPAVQQALAQPEGKEREKALRDAAMEWQKSDPASALAWAVAMPENPLNRSIVIAISQAWPERDGAASVAWGMARCRGNNKGYNALAFHLMVTRWTKFDHQAALAWADTVPADTSDAILSTIYFSLADGWAQADPAAAAAWAATVKSDRYRQMAIHEAAVVWSNSKPENAAVWAKGLPVADLKSAARPIFEAWRRRDAGQATAWLDALSLPDEVKLEMKKPKQ
jgi:hypothetical protein